MSKNKNFKDKIKEKVGGVKEAAENVADGIKKKVEEARERIEEEINARFAKEVVFYTTYGYRRGDEWVIPMRVWVRRRRPFVLDDLNNLWPKDVEALKKDELDRLGVSSEDFIADDCDADDISFTFDADPATAHHFDLPTTVNGLAEHEFHLPADEAERMIEEPGSNWLALTIKARGRLGEAEGRGRVVLLDDEGLSVVSDVDDTIKVTEILEGLDRVVQRTFLLEYEAVREMRERYGRIPEERAEFKSVAFHYVSGSPWPLYRPLQKFLVEREGFPEGTFHLKGFSKSLLDPASFVRDMKALAEGKMNTEEMKVRIISELMNNLPGRKFILYGDSGERDPEAFRRVRDADTRGQVIGIFIRDVSGDAEKNPARLDGMETIRA